MNKRDFLKSMGASALAIGLTPSFVRAAGPDVGPTPVVVYDSRFKKAARFARAAERKGARLVDTGGDPVSLWYRSPELFELAKDQVMIGYTTWSDLSAFTQLVAETRMHGGSLEKKPKRITEAQLGSKTDWPAHAARFCNAPSSHGCKATLYSWLAS